MDTWIRFIGCKFIGEIWMQLEINLRDYEESDREPNQK